MATLKLVFDWDSVPSLIETVFEHPLAKDPLHAIRGKTGGAFMQAGSFQWTAGVHALCILALRHMLACSAERPNSLNFTEIISGKEGSPAKSLDYSLVKECSWLADIFGCDSQGQLVAKRIFRRTNSSCKHSGPVSISISHLQLEPSNIYVFIGEQRLDGFQDLLELLNSLEITWKRPVWQMEPVGDSGIIKLVSNQTTPEQGCESSVGLVETRVFPSLLKTDEYFGGLVGELFGLVPKGYPIWGMASHWWWPIVNPSGEFENARRNQRYRHIRCLSSGDSKADRWVSEYYSALGVASQTNSANLRASDIWVCGDIVTETELAPSLKDLMEDWYTASNKKSNFDVREFIRNIYNNPAPITLRVIRDSRYASYLSKTLEFTHNKLLEAV